MKKIIIIMIAGALILSGCTDRTKIDPQVSDSSSINSSNPDTSVNENQSQNESNKEDSSSSSSEDDKKDQYETSRIKYPQLLPDKIKNHYLLKEADQNKNAVINCNWEILTDETPVENFMNSVKNKTADKLFIYAFSDTETMNSVSLTVIEFDGKNLYQYWRTAQYDEEKNIFDLDSNNITWNDSDKLTLKSVKIENNGTLAIEYADKDGYEPSYISYKNIRDIIPKYEEMEEKKIFEKYLRPLYYEIIKNKNISYDNFSDDKVDWIGLVENALIDENGDFWTKYPNGKISQDEFMKIINRYFDVDKSDVIRNDNKGVSRFIAENGDIVYEGGRGGAYPTVYAVDFQDLGDTSKITYKIVDAITMRDNDGVVTVKNMSDGTFRYLSIEIK